MFKIYKSVADMKTWKRQAPELVGETQTYDEAIEMSKSINLLVDMAPLVWIDGPSNERTQVSMWGTVRGQCRVPELADGSLFKDF